MKNFKPAVLKAIPEDFAVNEVISTPITNNPMSGFEYIRLQKRGFTTFQAVREIGVAFELPASAITYAGLKDEDGVTWQHLAVPGKIKESDLEEFNKKNFSRPTSDHMLITRVGYSAEPLIIGSLDGNTFSLTLRRLDRELANQISSRRHNLFFLNYYDSQRFGVPGGPKVTDLIGKALIERNHHQAMDLLIAGRSNEGRQAAEWTGSAEKFFANLDPRTVSFYCNAHESKKFNQKIEALVLGRVGHDRTYSEVREGLTYRFGKDQKVALEVALEAHELSYEKYRFHDGSLGKSTSSRATVLQTQIEADSHRPDRIYNGFSECRISFFLPAGSYATCAVDQLIGRLSRSTQSDRTLSVEGP
ncbi:tRNA pseudouridine(13) synthase TruD [Streptomyces sp. NPDC001139]